MAKLAYSKLGLKVDSGITIIHYGEQEIEVKSYLPIKEKMEMINRIVTATLNADDKHFNIPQVLVNLGIEVIINYTNITFTEKQKEDLYKIYDSFTSSTLLSQIIGVCERDYMGLQSWIFDILTKIYNYQNSAKGLLEYMNSDYNNLNFDIKELQENMSNTENLSLLKDVLTNLD